MSYERRDYSGAPASTTLASGINNSDTSITIGSGAGWPDGTNGPFFAVISPGTAGEEKIKVTSRSGTTLNSVTRGADDTSAGAHSSGAVIYPCATATDFDEANYWVAELAGAYDAAGDLAVADGDDSITTLAKGSNSTVLRVDSGGTLGYGTVTSAMITDGTIAEADLANSSIATAKIADSAVATAKIADNAVTAAKIATAVAGNGLAGGGGTALSVNVGTGLEISSDAVRIAAAAAGNGLSGGAGSALAVNVDDSTIEINSDTLRVKGSGITLAKLADPVLEALVPTGTILDYGGTAAPSGFLLCFGQAVSRSTYAALFTAIGTTFGAGDGSTTFNVPDYRGRAGIGQDDMGGTSANRITPTFAGFDGDTLGAVGGDERLQQHRHTINMYAGLQLAISAGRSPDDNNLGGNPDGAEFTSFEGAGGSQNVQPSIVVNKIIKT